MLENSLYVKLNDSFHTYNDNLSESCSYSVNDSQFIYDSFDNEKDSFSVSKNFDLSLYGLEF
jgi:hypothetical protein